MYHVVWYNLSARKKESMDERPASRTQHGAVASRNRRLLLRRQLTDWVEIHPQTRNRYTPPRAAVQCDTIRIQLTTFMQEPKNIRNLQC